MREVLPFPLENAGGHGGGGIPTKGFGGLGGRGGNSLFGVWFDPEEEESEFCGEDEHGNVEDVKALDMEPVELEEE